MISEICKRKKFWYFCIRFIIRGNECCLKGKWDVSIHEILTMREEKITIEDSFIAGYVEMGRIDIKIF